MQHIGEYLVLNINKLRPVFFLLICLAVFGGAAVVSAQTQVGQWNRFEAAVTNTRGYSNPYNDVALNVAYTKPDGSIINFWGFYDGGNTWRIRFMPDQIGTWRYSATFSDGRAGISGSFNCVASTTPGMISRDESNPRWFGFKGGRHVLLRSFHGGISLFASNFSNQDREAFLDWAQDQDYNMLSVGNHSTESASPTRTWDNPKLWPLDAAEYRQLETTLNKLADRRIIYYPFGGIFPQTWLPESSTDRSRLIRYYLARLAPYWNIVLNVAGPEPNLRNYLSSSEVNQLAAEIRSRDVFGHVLGVHNRDGDDPYRISNWSSYATLQEESTSLSSRSAYLLRNHTGSKPVYAQETLWMGNTLQPAWTLTNLRQHMWVHMMSATTYNVGDMNGRSFSGFSGSLDLSDRVQSRHDVPKQIWDFMETVPFYRMRPRQDLVNTGFALAEAGQHYLVYLPAGGAVSVNVGSGSSYAVAWVNARNPINDQRTGGTTTNGQNLRAPDSSDWVLQLVKQGGGPTPGELSVSSVRASAEQTPNVAANSLDDNLSTRWAAEGDGEWIEYDLGATKTISSLAVAWYRGNARGTSFEIQVSSDRANWATVYSATSSGTTLDPEEHDIADQPARYVRIVGYGNSENNWTSITETQIFGF